MNLIPHTIDHAARLAVTGAGHVARFLNENLGRCSKCMKTAFLCAILGWLAVPAAHALLPATAAGKFVYVAALGLTALWLLHLAVYTARILVLLWSEYVVDAASAAGDGHYPARRDLLRLCGSAVSFGVLAAVWLPTPAFAAGNPCGEGRRCPDSAPNCCSRSAGKCCDGNWACWKLGKCYAKHADARAACGNGTVVACS